MEKDRARWVGNRSGERPQISHEHRLIVISIGIVFILLANLMCLTGTARATLIDNGDGTVIDDDLGIMWLQASNDNPMTWSDAVTWADDLVFAGYDDWRLPSPLSFATGLPDTVWMSVNKE